MSETYAELMANAGSPLERVQIAVSLNQDYISYRCWEYERAAFAWKWRQDTW